MPARRIVVEAYNVAKRKCRKHRVNKHSRIQPIHYGGKK